MCECVWMLNVVRAHCVVSNGGVNVKAVPVAAPATPAIGAD